MITVLYDCFKLLPRRDRFLIGIATMVQASLVLLDILGVALIGSVFAIATSAVQGSEVPSILSRVLTFMNLEGEKPQTVVAYLGLFAFAAFLAKTLVSYRLTKMNLAFLSVREARISSGIAKDVLAMSLTNLNRFSTPQYQHAVTLGTASVMSGVIGNCVAILGEFSLQIGMIFALFFVSPLLTSITLVFFVVLLVSLNYYQGNRAKEWSRQATELDVITNSSLADAIATFREITVLERMSYFSNKITFSRNLSAQVTVQKTMLSFLSKYLFEISLVLLVISVGAFAFYTRSAIEAASLLAIFLAANSRIAPSMLRIQQGFIMFRGAMGASELFFEIYSHVKAHREVTLPLTRTSQREAGSNSFVTKGYPLVQLRKVSIRYPNSKVDALVDVDFSVPSGHKVSLVGPSGAGKTTLVDTLLGLTSPTQGEIFEKGVLRKDLPKSSRLKYSYVPQNCYLVSGSLIENVCLGLDREKYEVQRVWEVLSQVGLLEWVQSLPMKLYQDVGERGNRVSGGQRQRIGIARAIYEIPDLLVLDEATSALDADTEKSVSLALESLRGRVTQLVIAHRLSTVMNSDKVTYLDSGTILGEGTFSELRELVPDFDRQANLLGIS